MALFKKIDKVLAALGNMNAMKRLHVDTFTEDQINSIQGDKFAESEEGIMYAGISELNGYLFFETILICNINIKTFNGGTLKFYSDDESSNFQLFSDTQEIESDYSNVSKRYMTQISFDVTEEEIEMIRAAQFKRVVFEFKRKSITFLR